MLKQGVQAVVSAALIAVCGSAATAQNGNDACGSATVLTLPGVPNGAGRYIFSATGGSTTSATATAAGTPGMPTCVTTTSSKDVWYRVTTVMGGTLAATTCGTGTNFDTVVSIHTVCPGAGAPGPVACDDDGCGTNASSAFANPVSPGQVYYIRVGGYTTASGNFVLNVDNGPAVPHVPPATATSTWTGIGNAATGPDVTVGTVVDMHNYGTGTSNGINVTAFAVGTDSCNRGDFPVLWVDSGNRYATLGIGSQEHPVIAQNMYRYKVVNGAGNFDQIGQSWLKHGYLSTNSNGCGSCGSTTVGGSSFGGDALGLSCSDTYGYSLNGSQGDLGPRSQVNVSTGVFPFPHGTGDSASSAPYTTVGMRIQVPTSDITSQPTGTRYFVDTHYVTQDDATYVRPAVRNDPNPLNRVAINGLNNLSWREVTASSVGSTNQTFANATQQQDPAIKAWQVVDPAVTLSPADYLEHNDYFGFFAGMYIKARFWVGAKVTLLTSGMYHYEYAIFNLNSDRSAGSFTIPFPANASPTNVGFNSPLSHSGEPYSNAAWTFDKTGNTLKFQCDKYSGNPNANAIRWSTMYTIRFDSAAAPTTGNGTIGLFKPGQVGDALTTDAVGIPVPTLPPPCAADFDGDGTRAVADIFAYLAAWFAQSGQTGPGHTADINGDNAVTVADIFAFLAAWFAGCP